MRIELTKHNIKVKHYPGLAKTNFSNVRFKGDLKEAKTYKGYQALISRRHNEDLISYILNCPDRVNIAGCYYFFKSSIFTSVVHKVDSE